MANTDNLRLNASAGSPHLVEVPPAGPAAAAQSSVTLRIADAAAAMLDGTAVKPVLTFTCAGHSL
nr:hypothetical protein GCM10020063_010490 [Dactylosporangium thailandense]